MENIRSVSDTNQSEIQKIFKAQQQRQYDIGRSIAAERIVKLKRFHQAITDYTSEIRQALYDDLRKHPSETDLTEIYCITGEIKHAIRHLKKWMKPKRVATPIALLGTGSYIHYEPKGVVLIIAPWNFPLKLTFSPLVSAIAAGNCAMVKPSELTPHTSHIMKKMIESLFSPDEVALVEGGVDTSQGLLKLPFNHIFFTGASAIGKIVMEAASKHLASVTLELGGKSPTIVDETASVSTAARRIAWGKFINNGQTCIAPDYLFVHNKIKNAFTERLQKNLEEFYSAEPEKSESYCRMVNNRHFNRVKSYVDEAVSDGAKIISGGVYKNDQNYIAPSLLTDVKPDSALMQEEIFGPVLPINFYEDLNEPLHVIRCREIPLALYIYSNSRKNIKQIIQNTRAGGTVINHSVIHFYQNNLPFGGSNNSGIGKSHGFFGFQAFSNARGIMKQVLPFSGIDLMMPPYTDMKKKLIDLTIKWF